MHKNIQSTYIEIRETKQSVILSRSLEEEVEMKENNKTGGGRLRTGRYDQLNGWGAMLGRHYINNERVVPLG